MFLRRLASIIGVDLAIDLGTANTLFYLRDKGIILNEPSVIAYTMRQGEPHKLLGAGRSAWNMVEREPSGITVVHPLKEGVISDFKATKAMLQEFILRSIGSGLRGIHRIVISVPRGATQIERRAFRDVASLVGAREVLLIDEPMAVAISAGLPVLEATGSMVIDIGSGITEAAVISLGQIIYCHSVRVGSTKIDEKIIHYVHERYGFIIGRKTAELIKINLGTMLPPDRSKTMTVKGRSVATGLPGILAISSGEISEVLLSTAQRIVDSVIGTLEQVSPDLVSDICEQGIVLSGGGALIHSFDAYIQKKLKVPVRMAENPLTAVALGNGRVLIDPLIFHEAHTSL